MPTTIARRIRRIGLLPAIRENGVIIARPKEDPSMEEMRVAIQQIRSEHYARRDAAKKNPSPAKHRRSKSRKSPKTTDKKAA